MPYTHLGPRNKNNWERNDSPRRKRGNFPGFKIGRKTADFVLELIWESEAKAKGLKS